MGLYNDEIPEVACDKSTRYLWELGIEKKTGCEIMKQTTRCSGAQLYGFEIVLAVEWSLH